MPTVPTARWLQNPVLFSDTIPSVQLCVDRRMSLCVYQGSLSSWPLCDQLIAALQILNRKDADCPYVHI